MVKLIRMKVKNAYRKMNQLDKISRQKRIMEKPMESEIFREWRNQLRKLWRENNKQV